MFQFDRTDCADTMIIGTVCPVSLKASYKRCEKHHVLPACRILSKRNIIAIHLPTATNAHLQAVVSRLNTVAAIIGVQDSLQHIGPQLWFLQSLLGQAVAVLHMLVHRSLQHASPHNQGLMHSYLSGHTQYAATSALEPGELSSREL